MAHLSDETIRRYLSGELAGKARAAAEDHLATCPSCRRELGLYRAIDAVVGAAPVPDWVPEALLAEVSRKVRLPGAGRPAPARWWKVASAAAALALMLGVALYAENAHFWHSLDRQNQTLYAEHYSFVAAPQALAVRTVNLVTPE
ncbi:MAG: anti-sigma factor family protein [Chitinophagales bacterium]